MRVDRELLPGCCLIECDSNGDYRGSFVKTYHDNIFGKLGINFTMKEEYYSISKKNVVRGMHFQAPPFDHKKIVSCVQGAVLDVLLDLRQGSGYGSVASIELHGGDRRLVYIPKGIAHGFLSLESNSLMLYKTSEVHIPENDLGIRWDSFGFNWGIDRPILSQRDLQHSEFGKFKTPF